MVNISLQSWKPVHQQMTMEVNPVDVYRTIYEKERYGFLYESLESKEKRGRYSFVGGKPFLIFKSWGNKIEIECRGQVQQFEGNAIDELRNLVQQSESYLSVMPFSGGAVGYMAYDAIRYFEKVPDNNPEVLDAPDMYFLFPGEIIVFDHLSGNVDIIIYAESEGRIHFDELKEKLKACQKCQHPVFDLAQQREVKYEAECTQPQFEEMVGKAKEYINAGDIFQVVLSQRWSFEANVSPLDVYQSLRLQNPSPYMYFLHLDDMHVTGSSPEILVKLQHDEVTTRPLAGTRPRGQSAEEDEVLKADLIGDDKERAEHIMLVDLARNDIGVVCDYGSVHVTDLMSIERYSKVMHIVSNVVGTLRRDKDAFDLLGSTFPAGTVSGAPKIRAMEIIDELEPTRRGVYAGAIGYFAFSGDTDMCIAIRMIVFKDKKGYVQAGAGVVADSVPQKEYQETLNKARALIHAIETAGGLA